MLAAAGHLSHRMAAAIVSGVGGQRSYPPGYVAGGMDRLLSVLRRGDAGTMTARRI